MKLKFMNILEITSRFSLRMPFNRKVNAFYEILGKSFHIRKQLEHASSTMKLIGKYKFNIKVKNVFEKIKHFCNLNYILIFIT